MLTELTRPVTRRIGRLVVTLHPEGITIRAFRRRKDVRKFTWAQVASLATPVHPCVRVAEHVDGSRQLAAMGAADKQAKKDRSR